MHVNTGIKLQELIGFTWISAYIAHAIESDWLDSRLAFEEVKFHIVYSIMHC